MCLVNQNIADIPVIVAAIDPCLSCTSRLTITNRENRPGVVVVRAARNGSRLSGRDGEENP
jgi:Ni,Fe-hydrogenase III large subunit